MLLGEQLLVLAALVLSTLAALLPALTGPLRLLAWGALLAALLARLVLARVALVLLATLVRLILVLLVHLYSPWANAPHPVATAQQTQRSTLPVC